MKLRSGIILTVILLLSIYSQATTYFVSWTGGNDSNSGTTLSLPWKTIDHVNSFVFAAGDSILFKRNETWRGQLLPKSGNSNAVIYYGSYSNGNYPTILGSLSFNNISDWTNTNGNIWKCTTSFLTDIGNIIFNNSSEVGFKKWNLSDLQNQNEFWYDLSTGELSIYSVANPASLYSEIELALRRHIINQQNTSFVTYENLSIKYGGAHGFGGGNTANITIRSCEMSYIGGGDLNMDGDIRFGNGVEFWSNASNHTVEKCKIWEIYDTGLSNQNHTSTATQQNIRYKNNLIWNCGLSSFEYWNRPSTSITKEIYFENNTCLYAGSGWGHQRSDYSGIHVLIDNNTAQTDTVYIRNNIFYNAQRSIYAVEDNINGFLNIDYNLMNQEKASDTLFASFPSFVTYTFDSFTSFSSDLGKDKNSITGDPLFVDLASLDFKLTNASPCIDNGITTDVFYDFENNSRPIANGYDIGAFEYMDPLSLQFKNEKLSTFIYPNPTQQQFQIKFETDRCQASKINFLNSQGQVVYSTTYKDSIDKIDIGHLNNGIYYIAIYCEQQSEIIGKIQIAE